jgi:alpha 1,3-glucosidase
MILYWFYALAGSNCDAMRWCRDNRRIQLKGWSLKKEAARLENNIWTVPILANGTEAHLELKICQLAIGAWRFRVSPTRKEDYEFRFDAVLDDRIVVQSVLENVASITAVDRGNSVDLEGIKKLVVSVSCDPFKIDIRQGSRVVVKLNDNGHFVFEHNRSHVIEELGDSVPNGPTAVGLDATIMGQKILISGMNEHTGNMNFDDTDKDQPHEIYTVGLYGREGVIQLALAHGGGVSAGLHWLNPSWLALDISTTAEGRHLHFISEGGYIELHVFVDDLKGIVNQFGELTGRPVMPPLFALGYHQSKYGYMTQEEVLGVMENLSNHHIPWDIIWLDIDHLKGRAPFEFNHTTFPSPEKIFDALEVQNRWAVRACDCHLPLWPDHIQYQEGKKGRFFLRQPNGQDDYVAACWPGDSSYPDFLNRTVSKWYSEKYHYNEGRDYTTHVVHFWNDMNEPCIWTKHGLFPNDVRHTNGLEIRETHSIWGSFQAHGTYTGTITRNNPPHQRGFVLTRSYYTGVQKYAWAWSGDCNPNWGAFGETIQLVLGNGLTGFPYQGADVGGHTGAPSEELLVRWFQGGSWFYPFFREHCSNYVPHREPYLFHGDTYRRLTGAIHDRYMMIGVWYTHTVLSRRNSRSPVVPVWFEWPDVLSLEDNNYEILLADAILVRPVTEGGVKTVFVDKPPGLWYSLRNGRPFRQSGNVSVTLDDIPLYLRGGRIIPTYPHPGGNTIETIVSPLTLIVAVNESGKASGILYLDDGITFNYTLGEFIERVFEYDSGVLTCRKANENEKRIPPFLNKAVVNVITIYSNTGVRNVTGLSLLIKDEWKWGKNEDSWGSYTRRWDVLSGSTIVIICLSGIVVLGVLVGIFVVRKKREANIDVRPLISTPQTE